MITIYMDSSIKCWNKKKDGVVGFVVATEGIEPKPMFGTVHKANSNEAAVICLSQALDRVKNVKGDVLVFTSSYYINNILEAETIYKWPKRNWKTRQNKEIKHKEYWQTIYKALGDRKISVKYAKEHEYKSWLEAELTKRSKKYE